MVISHYPPLLMIQLFSKYFITSALPANINYNWNFGSILGFCLAVQIITGVFLSMHYTANIHIAFDLIEYILRDINYGWFIRYLHSNGASLFFIFVYLHIARALYYSSFTFPRHLVWNIGVTIYILMLGIAFLGYVLPFGQMSIWGATVITNLISAIPYIGNDLVIFIWGGFSVGNPTLNRFFSLHYLLPFLLAGLILYHLAALHYHGSTNPLAINSNIDKITFHPYFSFKDLYFLILVLIFFSLLIFFFPNFLGHSDNYIPANPLVTPLTISPDWFVLVPYAILRTIPNKLLGVLILIASLLVLYLLPLQTSSHLKTAHFRTLNQFAFWLFVGSYFILLICGSLPIDFYIIKLSILATLYYFAYFILILPLLHFFDTLIYLY